MPVLKRWLVLLSVLVVACGGATPAATAPTAAVTQKPVSEMTKVTLARGSGPSMGLLVLAEELGYYKDNGINATVRAFSSNGEAINAMVAGDVVGVTPSTNLINSLSQRNFDFKVLGVISRNPKDSKLVALQAINKPSDLKGKKIAVVAGTSSEMDMTLFLARDGLTTKDVTYVKADAPEVVAIMARGDADAFFVWEPFPTKAAEVMGNKVHVIATSEDLGITGALHMVMSTKFLTEHPEVGPAVMKSLIQAEKYLKANLDKSLEILARVDKISVADIKPIVQAAVFDVVADPLMVKELETTGAWMKDVGQIKAVPDFKVLVDASYLTKADATRVTIK